MLAAGMRIKFLSKFYDVIEVTEFGAKIKPLKKVGRKFLPDGKPRIISSNTEVKVIK